jgi:hypothetical protein
VRVGPESSLQHRVSFPSTDQAQLITAPCLAELSPSKDGCDDEEGQETVYLGRDKKLGVERRYRAGWPDWSVSCLGDRFDGTNLTSRPQPQVFMVPIEPAFFVGLQRTIDLIHLTLRGPSQANNFVSGILIT